MSQASKVLKEIATGAEYTALVQAIEKSDYEAIAGAYKSVNNVIEAKKKEILDKIDTLTRANKGDDRQQFLKTFAIRAGTTLPQWQRLNELMQLQKITEGEVIGVGSKGDPMVRTLDGKLTIISGLPAEKAEKGSRVTFRMTNEGPKVNFGQVIEYNTDFFYFLLNQAVLNAIRDRFNAIETRLKTAGEMTPALLNELLQEVEKVRDLVTGLRQDEKERVNNRILAFRKHLLGEYGMKMAMDFIEKQEADEITALCEADAEKVTCAMAAPGLFRYQTYKAVKAELFENNNSLKGYNEALKKMEGNIDSMDAAMKLMEFQSGFESIEPNAREYLQKIDQLFAKLNQKARNVVNAMVDTKDATADIQSQIEAAFGGKGACLEIRGVFRNQTEFMALREALTKLRTMLGNTASQDAEVAIRPYLSQKLHLAFGR